MDRTRVTVAELLRPRGNRGELAARSQTDVPGRLEGLRDAYVRLGDGSDLPVRVEDAWPHKGEWVLKLAGIDTIEQAERFRGADLWIAPENRAALPDGEFYQSDLIGCRLRDGSSAEEIGEVIGFQQYGGPPLMEVRNGVRELLVPFVPAYCRRIDLAARVIVMDLPAGLLDLE